VIKLVVACVLAVAAVSAVAIAAAPARADYGPGAQYQIELSANSPGPNQTQGVGGLGGGGIWLWIALNRDGSGDYAGSDCGHGSGAASDRGDVTWYYADSNGAPDPDGSSVVIQGVVLNGFVDSPYGAPFATTITVPRAYGHSTGTIGSFMTLPDFIPPFIGFSQLQVAP
jgi:hypothetical protein